jgi:hypothetical protein
VRLFKRRREPDDLWLRVRELGPPEWGRVSEHIEGDEQIGAENGWFIAHRMSPIDYGTDQPCTVFLTERGIYVDVRPDASMMGPKLVSINPYCVERAEALIVPGGQRFLCGYVTNYGPDGALKIVAVEFEWAPGVNEFVDTLNDFGKRFAGQTALAKSVMEDMDRGQDDQHA